MVCRLRRSFKHDAVVFQHRDIRQQLQKQFVTRHEKPGDVWTLEGRYFTKMEKFRQSLASRMMIYLLNEGGNTAIVPS